MTRLQNLLFALLGLFGLLFMAANLDLNRAVFQVDRWILYPIVFGFLLLLLVFWRAVRKVHALDVQRAEATDPLSGLRTMQPFMEALTAEIDRSRRKQRELTVIKLDIDYFTRYNQTHGLKAGDRVIKDMGLLVRESIRGYDQGFRLGNDEFSLILPETDRPQGRIVAERIRETFFSRYGGELALSIGLALMEDPGEDAVRLWSKATLTMEEARKSGGNRTRAYVERGRT